MMMMMMMTNLYSALMSFSWSR